MSTKRRNETAGSAEWSLEICILAGGLSARMGKDKARLRIGSRSLLGEIRRLAGKTGFPVRVIRRDTVQRCGPLGGVFTALESTDAERVLFLACDMPFVPASVLTKLIRVSRLGRPVFAQTDSPGFPFVLPAHALLSVMNQIDAREFALHKLAAAIEATTYRPTQIERSQLLNINTPSELAEARLIAAKSGSNRPRAQRRSSARPHS